MDQVCDGLINCLYGNDEIYCIDYSKLECPLYCDCSKTLSVDCELNTEKISRDLHFNFKLKKLFIKNLGKFNKIILDYPYSINQLIITNGLLSKLQKQEILNIFYLDISKNKIQSILDVDLVKWKLLQYLDLSYNPMVFPKDIIKYLPKNIYHLDLSGTRLKVMEKQFHDLLKLHTLKIIDCSINEIFKTAFYGLKNLKNIYLNNTNLPVFIPNDIFKDIPNLENFFSNKFELCCAVKTWNKKLIRCTPEYSRIKTCSDLIGTRILRILIWIVIFWGCCGNIFTLGLKLKTFKRSIDILYIGLSVSDFFLIIYLIIIASVDLHFKGDYIANDHNWRHSKWCNFSGIIATASMLSSNFFLLLITLERFFAICFPLRHQRLELNLLIISLIIVVILLFTSLLSMLPIFLFNVNIFYSIFVFFFFS